MRCQISLCSATWKCVSFIAQSLESRDKILGILKTVSGDGACHIGGHGAVFVADVIELRLSQVESRQSG